MMWPPRWSWCRGPASASDEARHQHRTRRTRRRDCDGGRHVHPPHMRIPNMPHVPVRKRPRRATPTSAAACISPLPGAVPSAGPGTFENFHGLLSPAGGQAPTSRPGPPCTPCGQSPGTSTGRGPVLACHPLAGAGRANLSHAGVVRWPGEAHMRAGTGQETGGGEERDEEGVEGGGEMQAGGEPRRRPEGDVSYGRRLPATRTTPACCVGRWGGRWARATRARGSGAAPAGAPTRSVTCSSTPCPAGSWPCSGTTWRGRRPQGSPPTPWGARPPHVPAVPSDPALRGGVRRRVGVDPALGGRPGGGARRLLAGGAGRLREIRAAAALDRNPRPRRLPRPCTARHGAPSRVFPGGFPRGMCASSRVTPRPGGRGGQTPTRPSDRGRGRRSEPAARRFSRLRSPSPSAAASSAATTSGGGWTVTWPKLRTGPRPALRCLRGRSGPRFFPPAYIKAHAAVNAAATDSGVGEPYRTPMTPHAAPPLKTPSTPSCPSGSLDLRAQRGHT
jgi:hypothetical protein